MLLYAVRHAKVIKPKGVLYGVTDYPADISDVKAFSSAAERVPAEPAIWSSSPLSRALSTAKQLWAAKHGSKPCIETSELIKEQDYGILEKRPLREVFKNYPDSSRFGKAVDNHDFLPPGGEAYTAVIGRVENWLNEEAQANSSVRVVITHRGVIQALMILSGVVPNKELWSRKIDYLSVHTINL